MYGAQTDDLRLQVDTLFENDVEMYGAQTAFSRIWLRSRFENDVEMYGAQTINENALSRMRV